jgi:hypothetical protein
MAVAGFRNVTVLPRLVYADESRPENVEGVKNIFIAMVDGVRETAISQGLIDQGAWDEGIRGLHRTTEKGGTFCYTFFKAVGRKEG